MSRDRYERKHRRTHRHLEAVAFMASANYNAVPSLSEALGGASPARHTQQRNGNLRLIAKSWTSTLERALFPYQESEEEQEAFTPEGRKRAEKVLYEMLRAICGRQP